MMIHGDPEFVLTLHSVIEFIGTFAFALSGIRLAASKHYDCCLLYTSPSPRD